MKEEDKWFNNWEGEVLGFGYGTGEAVLLPIIKSFLKEIPMDSNYDFSILEEKCGAENTWFMINLLANADNLEYGGSPRFGWLTPSGKLLKKYVDSKSIDEMYELLTRDYKYEYDIDKKDNPFLNEDIAYKLK